MPDAGARTRQAVQDELTDVAAHRRHANDTLDFEAYEHLSEQESDLLRELAELLPAQRRPVDGAP